MRNLFPFMLARTIVILFLGELFLCGLVRSDPIIDDTEKYKSIIDRQDIDIQNFFMFEQCIPTYPPYPTPEVLNKTDEEISARLVLINKIFEEIIKFQFDEENKKKNILIKERKRISTLFLSLINSATNTINPEFNFDTLVEMNVFPVSLDFLGKNEGFIPGMSPENIKDQKLREEYEKILYKNYRLSWESNIQHFLRDHYTHYLNYSRDFLIDVYSQSPRADTELVELLEKYKYPEKEKVKIFKVLNISYKGFRQWQTNDGLLTLTAKLISADKKEIKIEKEDGKQFTIEIVYLRQEDQDYVKRQLDSETKTLKNEKSKD